MFGSLGFTEIAFILILALLIFGPKKLPEIGKTLGKGLAEFRRASNELKRTLENEVAEDERAERRAAAQLTPLAPPAPLGPGSPVPQTLTPLPPPTSESAGAEPAGSTPAQEPEPTPAGAAPDPASRS